MKLEQQVISLDIAKRLKELGIKQESQFYFHEVTCDNFIIRCYADIHENDFDLAFSAFTVAELGEILGTYAESSKGDNGWYMRTISPIQKWKDMYPCKTEANARGVMLIHLLENKLMELPE